MANAKKSLYTESNGKINAKQVGLQPYTEVTYGYNDADYKVEVDNSNAFSQLQLAYNQVSAAGGGKIRAKDGQFALSGSIIMPKTCLVKLEGSKFTKYSDGSNNAFGGTVFLAGTSMTNMFQWEGDANVTAYANLAVDAHFSDLVLDGAGLANTAIYAKNFDYLHINHLRIRRIINAIKTVYNGTNSPVPGAIAPGALYVLDSIISMGLNGIGIDCQFLTQSWIENNWFSSSGNGLAWISVNGCNKIKVIGNEFNTVQSGGAGILLSDTVGDRTGDIIVNSNVFAVGTGNDNLLDNRTNASSLRLSWSGNTLAAGNAYPTTVNEASNLAIFTQNNNSEIRANRIQATGTGAYLQSDIVKEKTASNGVILQSDVLTATAGLYTRVTAFKNGTTSVPRGVNLVNGTPESFVSDSTGGIAIDYTSSTNPLYVKTGGTSTTGWTTLLTAATNQTITGVKTYAANIVIDQPNATAKLIDYKDTTISRFKVGITATNSNYFIGRHDSSGVFVNNPIVIDASTGIITLDNELKLRSGTASATNTPTINEQSGAFTTATLTTAALSVQTLTLTNSIVTATSKVFVDIGSYTGTINTNGVPLKLSVTPASGSVTINIYNAHATNALNGSLRIQFLILN